MTSQVIVGVIPVLFFAATVRTTFGFGAGLTAMPLLLLLIDIKVAAPVVAVISMIIAGYIIIRDKKSISFKETRLMILFAVFGVPIGLFFLQEDYKEIICVVLGFIVVGFALFKLFKPKLIELKNDKLAFLFCLISGILGGAYNVNGPPVIIYGTMRRWSPVKFRAVLQAVFLPLNIAIIVGHFISGNFSSDTIQVLLAGIGPVIAGIVVGTFLHKKINPEKFIKIIYFLLIAIGLNLIIKYI